MLRKLSLCLAACAFSLPGASILLIEDQSGFGTTATVLTNAGHTVTVVNGEFANGYANLLNLTFLQGFQMVIYGERGDGSGQELPANVAAVIEQYLQGGGNLLVTGYDILGSPVDANMAALLRVSDPEDQVSFNENWVLASTNHFILNGPFGDFRGQSFVGSGYDDDSFTPNPGVLVLATNGTGSYQGAPRLIFFDLPGVGGSVGFWNGGVSGIDDAQPDFSAGGTRQGLLLNWVAGATGSAPSVPEPSTLLLSGAGLALGALRLRRR